MSKTSDRDDAAFGAITAARTIWGLIEERARLTPSQPMLVDERGRTLEFAGFKDKALRIAAGLHLMGIERGMVVSWQLPTMIETVLLTAALSRLGAVQNPILHLYREREVGFALRETGARAFFIKKRWRDTDYLAIATSAIGDHQPRPEICFVDDVEEGDPSVLPPLEDDSLQRDAPLRWIYYTSGSTQDPKGVLHTDETLIAGGLGLAAALEMSPDDVGSIAFPFAHIGGPDYLVTMLSIGFPAVLLESFSPREAIEVLKRHNVTMVGGSTAFYVAYLGEQRKQPGDPILPRIRLMSGGGAPKPPEIHYEVMNEIGGRGVVHGYGMTEVPMIANGSPSDSDEQLANTDGKPIAGANVRIVTREGSPAEPGVEGEIRVKGPMVFKGYSDADLNADAFDADGFFRTGDLGRLRSDGHLVITGRLKDVIVRKGENISATEIEAVLYTHPKIAEVAVVGLPDRTRGERVVAVVELVDGVQDLTLEELASYCREAGLMTQKTPEQLELRTDWPRAGTGKIVKGALRDEYSNL